MDVEEGDVAILSFLNTVIEYYKKIPKKQQQHQQQPTKTMKQQQSLKLRLLAKLIGKFEEEEYHQSLSIIHSLLDLISVKSLYKQTTTLSILSTLLEIIPTPTVTNILQTPHGLNRIIDLFKNTTINSSNNSNNNEHDDEKIIIRNESIILAISLVKLNPGISKFMIFEDVYDSLMAIASFEYQSYLASRQSNIKRDSQKNGSSSGSSSNSSAIINGNLIIVKDCLELCIEMTKQESKMASETFLSNTMTCQVLTMLLDLRNGVYFRNYDACLDDYYTVLEEEEELRRKGGMMSGSNSSGGGGVGGKNGGSEQPYDRGLSASSSEDGLDDILLDTPSVRNGGNRSRGGRNVNGRDGNIDAQEEKTNPIPYTTDEEAEIISYALTLFQTLIQGGDEGFVDESKKENLLMLKKSASRDSTSSSPSPSTQVSSRIQSIISSKNTKRLSMLLFDMALYTLPPPNSPIEYYVSSVPLMKVQCQALSVMADLGKIAKKVATDDGNDDLLKQILFCPSMYLKEVECLERVMYLICTGGISFVLDEDDDGGKRIGGSKVDTLSEKAREAVNAAKKVSMHSLGLLRNILTSNEAKLMVMEAFSPPANDIIDETKEDESGTSPQVEISVIQKLVNTLGENLHLLNDPNFTKDFKAIDKERMYINIIGAAGALGVFLTNGAGETSREVLLRLPIPPPPSILKKINGTQDEDTNEPIPTLIECMMTYLELGTRSSGGTFTTTTPLPETSMDVTFALLRLLTEWIPETPQVISALLSSPNSVSLGFLLQQKSKKTLSVESLQVLQAMTGVLLGLCMESMDAEDDVGGWSTSSIMNLINVGIGIGKFTQLLEGLKRIIAEGDVASLQSSVGPWMCCDMERAAILQWYSSSVNTVRRKVVQELSSSNVEDNDESDNEDTDSDKKTVKSLSKLVAHQNSEIETLRQKLALSEGTMASQASEMNLLKRRIGSNPNKVDDLLDEYSAKILLLEIQAKNLKEEVLKNNSKHQSSLKQQNEELSQLKQDLETSHSEIEKVLTEKDALKDELKQLTFAYSNLETEFNRVTSNSSVQTIGDKTAESNNAQNSNHQALQSENLKLKNDIRNANDWMSKAVKKMDDLTNRNKVLEAEATHLSNGNAQSGIMAESLSREADEMKRQLHDITNERDCLQANIASYKEEISKLQTTQRELQTLQSDSSNLQSQVNQIELQLENEKKSSSTTIGNLQQQLNEKHEEILKLQTPLQNGNSIERKLQQENTKLSAAYKAAQDWMAQAVKTNEKLKNQLSEMKSQNANLQSNAGSARNQNELNTSYMEQERLALTAQRDEAIEREHSLDKKLQDLQASKDALSYEKKDLQDKLNEAMKEKAAMDEFKTKAETLEHQMKQTILEKNQALETEKNLKLQLEELGKSQEKLSKEICDLKAKNDEMQETSSDVEVLRQREISLKNELDTEQLKHASEVGVLEKALEEMTKKNEQLQEEIITVTGQNNLSSAEHEEQKVEHSKLQSQIESLQEENRELKGEKETNAATIENMHTRLNDFQTWTETAQERFKEVDLEKEALQGEIDRMESEKEKIMQERSEVEEKIKQLSDEVEFYKKKEEGDKSQEEKLRSEILSLHVEIGHLDGKNRALSEDNKVLEKKNVDLTSKADLLDEVEESLFEKENEVAMLQSELSSLKEKLQQMQQELDENTGKEQG